MSELKFFTQEEIEDAEKNGLIIKMYDDYKSGAVKITQYQEFMIGLLGNYIKKVIKRYNLQNFGGGGGGIPGFAAFC